MKEIIQGVIFFILNFIIGLVLSLGATFVIPLGWAVILNGLFRPFYFFLYETRDYEDIFKLDNSWKSLIAEMTYFIWLSFVMAYKGYMDKEIKLD